MKFLLVILCCSFCLATASQGASALSTKDQQVGTPSSKVSLTHTLSAAEGIEETRELDREGIDLESVDQDIDLHLTLHDGTCATHTSRRVESVQTPLYISVRRMRI